MTIFETGSFEAGFIPIYVCARIIIRNARNNVIAGPARNDQKAHMREDILLLLRNIERSCR